MAVTVHSADADDSELNTTINTTPLVDVMLVMLIIFLITVPVVIKNVPVQLPNAKNIPTTTKPTKRRIGRIPYHLILPFSLVPRPVKKEQSLYRDPLCQGS